MAFKHLEDNLEDEHVLPYLEFYRELQEPTRTVLGYALDIASYLDAQGLSEKYAIFGGYAVLSHLISAFGDSVAKVWRGSTDIDMGGNHTVLNSIRSDYHMSNDLPSPNIPHKRTLKLDTTGENECKIDFYLGNPDEKYGDSRINSHFGIPLRVVKPEFIIRNKVYTPENELHHYGDILAMISVLEKEDYASEQIIKILTHEQSTELQKRIVRAEKEFSKDRFGFFPGKRFTDDLKRALRSHRALN